MQSRGGNPFGAYRKHVVEVFRRWDKQAAWVYVENMFETFSIFSAHFFPYLGLYRVSCGCSCRSLARANIIVTRVHNYSLQSPRLGLIGG